MFELRDYQEAAHRECQQAFKDGYRRLLMVAPPRSGKGSIIAYQAAQAAAKCNRVLIWVHKAELVYEIQKRLRTQMGTDCGLIMAGEPLRKRMPIQVMSVMTGIRRNLSWINPRLIITDECHRILSSSQKDNLLPQFPEARLIGYTATPVRNDKKEFSEVFDKLIQITTWAEQEARKVLVPSVVYSPQGAASLDGIKLRMSADGLDYDTKELSKRFSDEKVLEALYFRWMQYTKGRLQTMCFNVDKANNKAVTEYFKSKGVNAVYVDEKTPKEKRKAILKKFYQGPFCEDPIMFLGNVALFCLDSETEILTSDGWVGIDEMTYEHKIANWNEDNSIFFEEPEEIYRRQRQEDEKMISVSSGRMNIRVTGNHTMIHKRYSDKKWERSRADELVGKSAMLPVAGYSEPFEQVIEAKELMTEKRYVNVKGYHFRSKFKDMSFEESKAKAKADYPRYLEINSYKPVKELSIAECKFIGFWIGDGSATNLNRYGTEYKLCQSSTYPYICQWIEDVIKECGYDSIKREFMPWSGNVAYTWSFGTGRGYGHQQRNGLFPIIPYLNKSGFKELFSMNQEQFDAFIEGFWMADGNHGSGEVMPPTIRISNTNKALLDIIQAVAVCRGYSCSVRESWTAPKKNQNQVFLIRMTKGLHHVNLTTLRDWMYLKEEPDFKDERVWCVKSSSGNIITRRNGRVCVTGNSEGIDCPTVKCVILNYATKSFAKLIQSAARGSGAMYGEDGEWLKVNGRTYKEKVIIIDMGSNFIRHETTLETYDAFGFDLNGKRKEGVAPQKECPECGLTQHIVVKECPACGYIFPPPKVKEEKKLASDVEFAALKTDQVLALKIMNTFKDDETVRIACNAHWLRLTAVVNGKGDPNEYARKILRQQYKVSPTRVANALFMGEEAAGKLLGIEDLRPLAKILDTVEKRKKTHSRYLRMAQNIL